MYFGSNKKKNAEKNIFDNFCWPYWKKRPQISGQTRAWTSCIQFACDRLAFQNVGSQLNYAHARNVTTRVSRLIVIPWWNGRIFILIFCKYFMTLCFLKFECQLNYNTSIIVLFIKGFYVKIENICCWWNEEKCMGIWW